MNTRCPLVFIEWEDSAQPTPSWVHLDELKEATAVLCASVGWLVSDGEDVKALAPNMGGLNEGDNLQVSGIIRIPTRCIVSITEIQEPALSKALDNRRKDGLMGEPTNPNDVMNAYNSGFVDGFNRDNSKITAVVADNERLLGLLSRIDQEISAGTSVSVGLGSRQRVDFWHSLCEEIKSTLGEKP